MKIAAYQAPLLPSGSLAALDLIRQRVRSCETQGVAILCCPEGILGGLADYAEDPGAFAVATHGDDLSTVLAPLASDTVTTEDLLVMDIPASRPERRRGWDAARHGLGHGAIEE